ncbi:MAG: nuclear transport factor 2 family protein [Bacteroidia bacterium]|nr:nuclear transport factor 2 family protein [Bacteroidia bacterium]
MDSKKELVLKYENQLFDAMLNADVEMLEQLLHEDLLFNIPGGQTITRAMDLDAYMNQVMTWSSIYAEEQTVNIIDDNAVVVSTVKMKGKYYDHEFDQRYRFLRVWKLVGQDWQVIAGSSCELLEPPE